MKKFIALSLLGLLIIAFSATVHAQKLDMRMSGFIDAQTFWYRNVTPGSAAQIYRAMNADYNTPDKKAWDKTVAYLEARARLKFDAIMDKNLSGTILFEMDSSRWGETTPLADQRNAFGVWNGDRGAVEVKNVYIDFGLPYFGIPVPMTMRVGLQPLSIRNPILVYTDGMGVTAGLNIAPVMIQPLWFKAIEGRDGSADDVDVYGLHANVKINTLTIGGYGLYYNMNSFPFPSSPTAIPAYGARTDNSADMLWLGAYMDGKLGPLNVVLDFIYDTGKVESRKNFEDVDYSGWMGYMKVEYPWELFNFGLVAMYASGADADDTDPTGLPNKPSSDPTANSKVKSYVVPPGSESGAIFGESLVVYSSWVNRGDSGIGTTVSGGSLARGGTGGTWMAKLFGSYKIAPWYKITAAVLYIGDTTKSGNTFGNARDSDGTYKDSKSIGWEFDLYNEFQIYKNLKYTVAGGILAAGDALKFYDPATGCNEKLKTPWIITTNLAYNF